MGCEGEVSPPTRIRQAKTRHVLGLMVSSESTTRAVSSSPGGEGEVGLPPLSPWEWIVTVGVFLLGVAARSWRLNAEGLWLDEITAWIDSGKPVAQIGSGYHAVAFLSMKASRWAFGDANAALRLPGMVGGLAAVALVWWTLRRGFGRTAALIGLVFVVFSPFQVHFSRDANYYGLTLLFSALTLFLLDSFFRRPRAWMAVALAATAWLAFRTHPFNLALGGSAAVALSAWAWREREGWVKGAKVRFDAGRGRWLGAGVAVVAVGLLFIGWRAGMRVARVLKTSRASTQGETVDYSLDFTTLSRINADLGGAFYDHRAAATVAGWSVVVLAVIGIVWASRRRGGYLAQFGGVALLLPHFVLFAVPFGHFFNPRYLTFQSPILLCFAALGVAALAGDGAPVGNTRGIPAWRRVAAAALLAIWLIHVIPCDARLVFRERQPYARGAAALSEHARPGDKVLCFPPYSRLALEVSLDRQGLPSPRLFTSDHLGEDSFATFYRMGYLGWMDADPLYYFASFRGFDRNRWPLAWRWFEPHFDTVFEEESAYIDVYARTVYDVDVYRFRYPGDVVMPFLTTEIQVERDAAGADGAFPRWTASPLILMPGRYAVELRRDGQAIDPEGWTVFDGGEPRAVTREDSKGDAPARMVLELEDGLRSLQFCTPDFAGDEGHVDVDDVSTLTLSFGPPRERAVELMGGMTVDFGPFRYVSSALRMGSRCLWMQTGAWADYLFELPEAGLYSIRISAMGDRGLVDVVVEIDDRPLGRVQFAERSVKDRTIPWEASPGRHRLRVFAGREPLVAARNGGGDPQGPSLMMARIAVVAGGENGDDRVERPSPEATPRLLPRNAERPW